MNYQDENKLSELLYYKKFQDELILLRSQVPQIYKINIQKELNLYAQKMNKIETRINKYEPIKNESPIKLNADFVSIESTDQEMEIQQKINAIKKCMEFSKF